MQPLVLKHGENSEWGGTTNNMDNYIIDDFTSQDEDQSEYSDANSVPILDSGAKRQA